MGFRAFFLVYIFLFCGVVAFADVVVENKSNDTLHVAAVFEGSGKNSESNGFWTVPPKSEAVLLKEQTGLSSVWLRVLVKSPTGRPHELFPVGATRVRISPNDCAWTSEPPVVLVCKAKYRFSAFDRSFPVSMGSSTTTNHLRTRILVGRSYEFFQVKPDTANQVRWIWTQK